MRENKTCLRKELETISTPELEEKLQEELRKEYPDEKVVLPVLQELEERAEAVPIEITEDHRAAWEKFKRNAANNKNVPKSKSWLAKAVAAAAVVCVFILAIPRQAGAENLFDRLVRFADGVFQFFDFGSDPGDIETEYVFTTDNSGLQQLYDKMTELGVKDPVVPMWLPEGYQLTELKVLPAPDCKKVHANFEKLDSTIVMSFRMPKNATYTQYERKLDMEVYEIAGVAHAIVENEKTWSAAWIAEGIECSVTVDQEKEVLIEIIRSIYRRNT